MELDDCDEEWKQLLIEFFERKMDPQDKLLTRRKQGFNGLRRMQTRTSFLRRQASSRFKIPTKEESETVSY